MGTANADQAAFWNDAPGQNWVAHQADMDSLLATITARLLAVSRPRRGEAVLDIGCGAGDSTFALAEAVAPGGRVLGLDISLPLLERARARQRELGIDNASFVLADAQDHPLAPGAFDLAASRFGVMFFADTVAALGNIARGLRPGGRMAFVAWAGPEHNPCFTLPQRIATARLGVDATSAAPDAPGPMALQDAGRVVGLMKAAGLLAVEAEIVDIPLHHPGGIEAAVRVFTNIGAGRLLREKGGTEADRAAIADGLREALAPFVTADGIRIPAQVIIFTATTPS